MSADVVSTLGESAGATAAEGAAAAAGVTSAVACAATGPGEAWPAEAGQTATGPGEG